MHWEIRVKEKSRLDWTSHLSGFLGYVMDYLR